VATVDFGLGNAPMDGGVVRSGEEIHDPLTPGTPFDKLRTSSG
jgi:hypothetical protein